MGRQAIGVEPVTSIDLDGSGVAKLLLPEKSNGKPLDCFIVMGLRVSKG